MSVYTCVCVVVIVINGRGDRCGNLVLERVGYFFIRVRPTRTNYGKNWLGTWEEMS